MRLAFRARRALSLALVLLPAALHAPPAHAADRVGDQWYLEAMQADRMWGTVTGEGVTVAVIDNLVDRSLPELKGRLLPGKSYHPGSEPECRTTAPPWRR